MLNPIDDFAEIGSHQFRQQQQEDMRAKLRADVAAINEQANNPPPATVTYVDLAFADGRYRFQLRFKQIVELERVTGSRIGAIYGAVVAGHFGVGLLSHSEARYADSFLVETIRQGLIGGGKGWVNDIEMEVSSLRANMLIESYVIDRPIAERWTLAKVILSAVVNGLPADIEGLVADGDGLASVEAEAAAED